MRTLADLRVKIFADGANVAEMRALHARPYVRGFTTNPTLMHKAGVRDYEAFAREIVAVIRDRPISFEVFADDFADMECQARHIAAWADNVYVKIPITNTLGQSSCELVRRLSRAGVKINLTAILTLDQVAASVAALAGGSPSMISVFAGRIADSGRDPVPLMRRARALTSAARSAELIWASPRELLNVLQADAAGCDIITLTSDLLGKLPLLGRDLRQVSRETVQMFHDDAARAGFRLITEKQPA